MILRSAALVFGIALLAGCSDKPPVPGKRVDIGGYSLHINCTGEPGATPTVVIEGGAGVASVGYHWVQDGVSRFTRVCSYDRAGMGWSDASPYPRDARHISLELHTLLEKAGERPPYVIAGHSIGGLMMPVFTKMYPNEVVGLVFMDTSHPKQKLDLPTSGFIMLKGAEIASSIGLGGVLTRLFDNPASNNLPAAVRSQLAEVSTAPSTFRTMGEEVKAFHKSARQTIEAGDLDDLPVVVISAAATHFPADDPKGKEELAIIRDKNALQEQTAKLSTSGRQIIMPEADHMTLFMNKQHASKVVALIRETITAARAAD